MRRPFVSTFGRVALLAGILSVGMVSWGIARATIPATSAGMPPTAQTMWAVVNSNGTKARAFPSSVTSLRPGPGLYAVTFPHDLTGCAFVATTSATPPQDTVTVFNLPNYPNRVAVQIQNLAGTNIDNSFHLAVLC
jgi:hypothetical protein